MEEKGILYIVATPIGNLEDITFRAVRILKEVDVILCEDTRHSIKLLNHYEIKNKLISYHKFNEKESSQRIINMLNNGENVALISDAGLPLISDPGNILTKALVENDISFYVIPGATASLSALILSGFDTSSFTFVGFLPKKYAEKEEKLLALGENKETLIFYSSPYELVDFLKALNEIFPTRMVSISKEITKIHEKTFRGYPKELLEEFSSGEIKGEYVICVEGFKKEEGENILTKEEIKEKFILLTKDGVSSKEALKLLSQRTKIPKGKLYDFLMKK